MIIKVMEPDQSYCLGLAIGIRKVISIFAADSPPLHYNNLFFFPQNSPVMAISVLKKNFNRVCSGARTMRV